MKQKFIDKRNKIISCLFYSVAFTPFPDSVETNWICFSQINFCSDSEWTRQITKGNISPLKKHQITHVLTFLNSFWPQCIKNLISLVKFASIAFISLRELLHFLFICWSINFPYPLLTVKLSKKIEFLGISWVIKICSSWKET